MLYFYYYYYYYYYYYSGQNGDIKSPKRLCTDYRSVLVERNSFASPVKDRLLAFSNLKSKLPPPPLQSAFARYYLM
jgi:retinoblastoma-like protein 1